MNNHFFDQQNLTKEAFVAKKDEQINKPKTKEMICPEESCDDFFEILQGKLKEIKNSEAVDFENLLQEMPECNFVLKRINILGNISVALIGN